MKFGKEGLLLIAIVNDEKSARAGAQIKDLIVGKDGEEHGRQRAGQYLPPAAGTAKPGH